MTRTSLAMDTQMVVVVYCRYEVSLNITWDVCLAILPSIFLLGLDLSGSEGGMGSDLGRERDEEKGEVEEEQEGEEGEEEQAPNHAEARVAEGPTAASPAKLGDRGENKSFQSKSG